MTMKKMIAFTLVAIVVLLVLVVGAAIVGMNDVAKAFIEEKGSEVVGTAVTLDSVDISLLDQSVTLHKLAIANPAGFNQSYVFSMEEVILKVEVASLLAQPIVFNAVLFDGVDIVVEQNNRKSSMRTLMKTMRKNAETEEPRSYQVNGSDNLVNKESASTQMMIHSLRINNVKVTMVMDGQADRTVELNDIIISNIGPMGPKGLSVEVVWRLVMAVKQTVKQLVRSGLSEKLSDENREHFNKMKFLLQ